MKIEHCLTGEQRLEIIQHLREIVRITCGALPPEGLILKDCDVVWERKLMGKPWDKFLCLIEAESA